MIENTWQLTKKTNAASILIFLGSSVSVLISPILLFYKISPTSCIRFDGTPRELSAVPCHMEFEVGRQNIATSRLEWGTNFSGFQFFLQFRVVTPWLS